MTDNEEDYIGDFAYQTAKDLGEIQTTFNFTPPKTHKVKVLAQLKSGGHFGAYAHELARQDVGGHRFGEYIRQLRADGHTIEVVRIKGNTYKYYLSPERLSEAE